jgi:GAF domain-containing protein
MTSDSVDPILERVVEQASELLRAPKVALAIIEEDPHFGGEWVHDGEPHPVLRFVATRGLSAHFAQRTRPTHWRDGTTPMAIKERRPVWSADLLRDPNVELTDATRRAVEAEGYRAVLSVPLLAGAHVIGALVIYRDEAGPFSAEAVELAQVFATQAAVAIENARLYRRAEDRATKLKALSALTQLIVSATASDKVFHAVASASTMLLGARLARVWIEDAERRVVRIEASQGLEAEGVSGSDVGFELPSEDTGLVGLCLRERRPVYGRDLQLDPRRSPRLAQQVRDLHAFAALPLVAGGRAVGVLFLVFAEVRDFADEDQEIMGLLADQAAIAIRQAQLYREGDRRRDEAEVMAELTSSISASLELGDVLARVANGARDLCRADLSRIALRTPDDPVVRFRFAVGSRLDPWKDVRLEPGKGAGGRVLATGEPFRTSDYQRDARISDHFKALAGEEGIVAQMVVPIRTQDETHGVMYVANRSSRPFTDHDEAILRRLADYAGAAIKNATLYQGMRTALDQLAKSQAALVQNERLRALGEMAAGVAHDFNNMLAVIVGRTELLLKKTDDPAVVRGLDDVRRAASTGAATVRRIQNFTGTRRARPPGLVALGDVVREVVQLTRVRWKDEAQRLGIRYDVAVDGDAPAVAGHADELREVFTNLLNNALDAMPEGGHCAFRLAADAQTASVEVEDTGAGMTPDVSARIFEPFFTTKGPKGSGLGLSVSWGIVSSSGGTITVDSIPGVGTCLRVKLPIPSAPPDEPGITVAEQKAARARVLVIDDDETVRQVLADMLVETGHTVAQAASGTAGLAICKTDRFDLVITDLSMPEMSGWELVAAVRSAHPRMALGMVTGWGEQVDASEARRYDLKFVLAKPFSLDDVTRVVAGALKTA